jgi:hypothetical protein
MDVREVAEPVVQELLSAHAVLPEQFWNGQRGISEPCGERALMWAVFADGIDCYRRNARGTSLQQRLDFKEAEHWIFSTDWNWPFSFVNLCEVFGFDPAAVRRALQHGVGSRRPRALRRQRFRSMTLRAA